MPVMVPAASLTPGLGGDAATAEGGWTLRTPEGQEFGPVPKAELDRWAAEGRVSHDCELRVAGGGWRAADQVYPELRPQPLPALPSTASATGDGPLAGRPGGDTPASKTYALPDRGEMILSLAILGWLVCPILSVAAWVMGTADLNEMRAGRMDPRSQGLTQAGRIMGMLHALTLIVAMVVAMFVMLVVFGMRGGW
ncbi:MAG: hypothetical protein J5I93_04985 [Pirellulaceae bacterium]|nr:hypothetical protein [Pirellulaceae bacterium]